MTPFLEHVQNRSGGIQAQRNGERNGGALRAGKTRNTVVQYSRRVWKRPSLLPAPCPRTLDAKSRIANNGSKTTTDSTNLEEQRSLNTHCSANWIDQPARSLLLGPKVPGLSLSLNPPAPGSSPDHNQQVSTGPNAFNGRVTTPPCSSLLFSMWNLHPKA